MSQMTTKKIFNFQILVMILLSVLFGAYLGYRDTASLWQQNSEHNTAYLSAIVDRYRADILNGEFRDLYAEIQGSTQNLGTAEINIKNFQNDEIKTIQSPFVKENDVAKQNQICGDNNSISLFKILRGCQKQGFTVSFDEHGKYPFLEISWNVISDAVPVLLAHIFRAVAFFLLMAMIVAYFINRLMQDEVKRVSALQAVSQMATQVAHDIRSPLAALNVAASQLTSVPEEQRVLIRSAVQRITDIANDLSAKKTKSKNKDADDEKQNEVLTVQLLSGLIESLVSEKRVQFRSKLNIKIESEMDEASYGLFAKIQGAELKRVLSNLVNNAVEAMGDSGTVILSLRAGETMSLRAPKGRSNLDSGSPRPVGPRDDVVSSARNDCVCIIVSDNGKGIPSDILPKLMQKGATFGKEAGSGLGLFHAKETVQRWHGDVRLESQVGQGTKVILEIPLEPAPDWFVSEINLGAETQIVILDDDQSIHQIWQNRFDEMGIERENIFHFTTAEELIKWHEPLSDRLFLCDYELLGSKKTALEVVEELGIQAQAILVTSRFEEENVRKNCERLKIKLLPKNLSGFVPFCHCEPQRGEAIQTVSHNENIDAVLIDDDPIIRSTWQAVARIKGKNLAVHVTVDDFFKACGQYEKQVLVYIDSNLGNDIKGEVMAKEISKMGFENIYLATGYHADDFNNMPWIKGVVDKVPPFFG